MRPLRHPPQRRRVADVVRTRRGADRPRVCRADADKERVARALREAPHVGLQLPGPLLGPGWPRSRSARTLTAAKVCCFAASVCHNKFHVRPASRFLGGRGFSLSSETICHTVPWMPAGGRLGIRLVLDRPIAGAACTHAVQRTQRRRDGSVSAVLDPAPHTPAFDAVGAVGKGQWMGARAVSGVYRDRFSNGSTAGIC